MTAKEYLKDKLGSDEFWEGENTYLDIDSLTELLYGFIEVNRPKLKRRSPYDLNG